MLQSASRALLRSSPSLRAAAPRSFPSPATRRYASTAPADKPRSLRSSALRWGAVVAGLYYYNTSKVFAEEPAYAVPLPETDRETEIYPTVDELAARRKQQTLARQQAANTSNSTSNQNASTVAATPEAGGPIGSSAELEEEAGEQGAFNPETGEINWDCPCLGGMANGPCGEQFKAAFSCFVYSKEEPKGMDCIDRFKNMQDCFREHPDVYGAELADEDEEEEISAITPGETGAPIGATPIVSSKDDGASTQPPPSLTPPERPAEKVAFQKPETPAPPQNEIQEKKSRAKAATQQVRRENPVTSETEEAVPKAWHDSTPSSTEK
ncbi:MAG: Oxidoreductase [Bogoriella megaspora]|nr:MAG: Oxidoreductase [Bogoriella megaspora]